MEAYPVPSNAKLVFEDAAAAHAGFAAALTLRDEPRWRRIAQELVSRVVDPDVTPYYQGDEVLRYWHRRIGDLPEFREIGKTNNPVFVGEHLAPLLRALAEAVSATGAADNPRAAHVLDHDALMAPIDDELARAIVQGTLDVRALETALGGAGWGTGEGREITTDDPAAAVQLARRIINDPELRRVLEVAGWLRACARKEWKGRMRPMHGTPIGVEVGGNIDRLLPTSRAMLIHADPRRRGAARAQLLDRQLPQYAVKPSPEGHGPVVVLIDFSASMRSGRHIYAKGIACAIQEMALLERRPVHFVCFADTVLSEYRWAAPDVEQTVRFATQRPTGGTAFAPAFEAGCRLIASDPKFRRADILLISDGYAGDEARAHEYVERLREARPVNVYGLFVNDDAGTEGEEAHDAMSDLCDSGLWRITELTRDNSAAAAAFLTRSV